MLVARLGGVAEMLDDDPFLRDTLVIATNNELVLESPSLFLRFRERARCDPPCAELSFLAPVRDSICGFDGLVDCRVQQAVFHAAQSRIDAKHSSVQFSF